MAARSRWGKMLENGKGPGSWRQALRQGELELKDMVAVLKYLQEAGHPDEVREKGDLKVEARPKTLWSTLLRERTQHRNL